MVDVVLAWGDVEEGGGVKWSRAGREREKAKRQRAGTNKPRHRHRHRPELVASSDGSC